MLTQLVYISTMRGQCSAVECGSILDASRANNAAAGITGLLVAGGTRFLQLLEGEPAAVEQRFDVIRADPRHFAIVLLDKRLADRRQCPDWAMGVVRGGDCPAGERLSEIVQSLVAPIAEPYLRAQFTSFAALHEVPRAA